MRPLLVLLLTVLAPSLAHAQGDAADRARPNVLVLFADDQCFRTIGGLNNPDIATPNLDRLVARGTAFTNAYNMGGWHGAICVASRAMLMTGQTLWDSRGSIAERPMWPQWLADAGYQTHVLGKWHNGQAGINAAFPPDAGAQGPHFVGGMLSSTNMQGDGYDRPAPDTPDTWLPDDPTRGGMWMTVDGYTIHASERWADGAVDFLRHHDTAARPFFLYVAFNAPHDPRQSPTSFLERYPVGDTPLPPNAMPEHPFLFGVERIRDEVLGPYPRTDFALRTHRAEYYAIIEHMDAQIGRILDTLDAQGMTDNTLIVFSADHGLAVGEHGLLGKQNLYEHSARVPLLLAGPGVPEGEQRDALVYLHSMVPTTLDAAGVPVHEQVAYPSLWPVITGDADALHDAIYLAYENKVRAVRVGDWKLIRYPQIERTQLFDLSADPWEMNDLSAVPAYADTLRSLNATLDQLMSAHRDPLVTE